MDQRPLVEVIEAGREFLQRLQASMEIGSAFWLKRSDADEWKLYIASPEVNDGSTAPGYRKVVAAGQQVNSPELDLFQVKLIGVEEPIAVAIEELRDRFGHHRDIPYGSTYLGGMTIDGVFIYRDLNVAATTP